MSGTGVRSLSRQPMTGAASDPVDAYPRFEHEITADVLRVGLNWRF